jgi:CHAD domain-containing protein
MSVNPPQPYRLDTDAGLSASFLALAGDLVARIEADLGDEALTASQKAHEARKKLKRLRGLWRLTRTLDKKAARTENNHYRDIGRILAPLRDHGAMRDTFASLAADFGDQMAPDALDGLHAALMSELDREKGWETSSQSAIDIARAGCQVGRARLHKYDWVGREKRWRKSIAKGFNRSAMQTEKRFDKARKSNAVEPLHDLRKALKYSWMHLKLVRDGLNEDARQAQRAVKAAADTLGQHQDICALMTYLREGEIGTDADRALLATLADRRLATLRDTGLAEAEAALALLPALKARHLVRPAAQTAA